MYPNLRAISKVLSGSFMVKSGPGIVYSITVVWTNSFNRINFKDGVDLTGLTIFQASRAALAGVGDETQHFEFPGGLRFNTGIYYERFNLIPYCTVTYI